MSWRVTGEATSHHTGRPTVRPHRRSGWPAGSWASRTTRALLALGSCGLLAGGLTAAGQQVAAAQQPARPARALAASGATVTFAEQPATIPNYIFPMMPSQVAGNVNSTFQYLMYRPLYSYGKNGQPVLNEQDSLALPPVYSAHDTKVTIQLKRWKWSDGTPITARDVIFWINLLRANKTTYYNYVPGEFPDDVAKDTAAGPETVVLTLTKPVTPVWFTDNELSQIIPLPQQTWDRTSLSGPDGNDDTTTAGAKAVFKFLNAQSSLTADYGSSKLWKVVSGPFVVQSLSTNGRAVLVPNPNYSGTKPRIGELVWEPFTSADAEFNALVTGGVDYGYVPFNDIPALGRVKSAGYRIEPWPAWSINYIMMNFNNPTVGPLFKQLYIRQALQYLIDQTQYVKTFLGGYGYPTYGPVPTQPKNPYVTSVERHNPYPYSPSTARRLLFDHGWRAGRGGTLSCARPGTAARDCGAGISAGTSLSFSLEYTSGSPVYQGEMETFQGAASEVGVKIALKSAPFASVIGNSLPCTPKQASCADQMQYWGGGWVFSPDYYPSGENFLAGGAELNSSNYDDPVANKLIEASISGGGLAGYESYVTKQLPLLWMPEQIQQISAISSSLHGIGQQNPIFNTNPENWYLSGAK